MLSKKNIALTAIASAATLMLATSATAAVSGPYFGVQLGEGFVKPGSSYNVNASNAFTSLKVTSFNRFAGRVYAGYQINPTFSAELGYTGFGNASKTVTNSTFAATNKMSMRTYAVDLVGKVTAPLDNGLSVYGKAGGAYLNTSGRSSSVATNGVVTSSSAATIKSSAVYPTIGAGVSYQINQNVATDVSWTHIQKVGGSRTLANTDFVGVGLSYSIG